MLKIGKFAMLMAILVAFGCGKDDTSSKDADIVGTWNLISVESDDYKTVSVANGFETVSTSTFHGKDFSYTYTFKDDKTLKAGGVYTAVLVTTTNGQEFTSEIPGIAFADTGTWSIDGDKITIKATSQNEAQTGDIITLDKTTLKLKYAFSKSQVNSGFTSTTTGTLYYTLEKK